MSLSDFFLKLRYLLYVGIYGRFSKRPYHCQFQVTRRCNLRCGYCCVWRSEPGRELSLKEIELLARNLRLSGLKSVVITGGEPLLREDIVEIIGTLKKEKLIVRLQTNGLLLDSELTERIFNEGLDDIYISLDTLMPERFKLLSGSDEEDIHRRLMENLKMVSDVARRYGAGRFLLTVLTPLNCDEVDSLVKFANQWGYLIGLYGIETAGSRAGEGEIRVSGEVFKMKKQERVLLSEAFRKALSFKRKSPCPIFNSKRLLRDYIDFYSSSAELSMKWRCNAGRYYFVVLPEGKVSICNSVEPIEGYNYCNLPELYCNNDREEIFKHYRALCSGCICTKQLEYLLSEPGDVIKKSLMYLYFTHFKRRQKSHTFKV